MKKPHYFLLKRDKKCELRWSLRAGNNRIVADSGEGYKRKRDALMAIAKFKVSISDAEIKGDKE